MEWIKCSEQMPEEDTLCLAIDDQSIIWTAHFDDGILMPDIAGFYIPEFTHWMPLPAPPAE